MENFRRRQVQSTLAGMLLLLLANLSRRAAGASHPSRHVNAAPGPTPHPHRPCFVQFAMVTQACAPLDKMPRADNDGDGQHGDGSDDENGDDRNSAVEHCCRWMKQMDDYCACHLFLRLPPFLTKPRHSYMVAVEDGCEVTYTCEEMP